MGLQGLTSASLLRSIVCVSGRGVILQFPPVCEIRDAALGCGGAAPRHLKHNVADIYVYVYIYIFFF